MHRPHIPKLAFGQPNAAQLTRPQNQNQNHHQQQALGIQGVAATVTSPTRAAEATAAASHQSHPLQAPQQQLFHSRAAPPTSSASSAPPRIPPHHISEEFRALEDEQREEEDEEEEEEDDSHPITRALDGLAKRNGAASASSAAYARAEELLDQSEDDDVDSRPPTAAAGSSVTRRPLRDTAFVAEDGITSERVISTAGKASRRTSRATTARSDGSATTASAAAHAASNSSAAAAAPARSRLDRGSLRTWVSTAAQMRHRGELLEKEHGAYLKSRQAWFQPGSDELRALDDLERGALEANDRIRREREALTSEMKRIASLVGRFKAHVASPTDQEAYVTQLRQLMDAIEESLAGFKLKAKEKYIALNKAEAELETECDALMVGFERWTEVNDDSTGATTVAGKAKAKSATAAAAKSSDADDLKDSFAVASSDPSSAGAPSSTSLTDPASIRAALEQLDDAIAGDGGATGGWDPRDHAHYLKLRTQAGSGARQDPVFLARLVAEISGQTPTSAMAHLDWHDAWKQRVDEKKRLIALWKEAKERARDVEGLQEELERQQEWEARERKEIHALQEAQRAEKAATVAEWKARKQAKEDARQAKIQAAKEEKEMRAREQQEAERRRLRSIVSAYQEEQAVLSLVSQIQSQPTQRALEEKEREEREARRRLKEKQEEELRRVKEKREAKAAETARAQERKAALERASAAPATHRDPSRLTQPTGAMLARARQREQEEEEIEKYKREHGGRTPSTMMGRTSLGHTAMPAWRKGL